MTNAAEQSHRVLAECLREAGWEITIEEDGFSTGVIPEDQRPAYDADQQRCSDKASEAYPPPKVTEAEFRRLYAYQLTLVECLRKEGFPPTEDTPSEQDYLEEALREGGSRWNPWTAVGAGSTPELEKTCPQLPPDW